MGNFSKGVNCESSKVVARCPRRKSVAEAQSLKPRPAFHSGVCSAGIANAPSATTGVRFRSSRRLMLLNFRLLIRESMNLSQGRAQECGIHESQKGYTRSGDSIASQAAAAPAAA